MPIVLFICNFANVNKDGAHNNFVAALSNKSTLTYDLKNTCI